MKVYINKQGAVTAVAQTVEEAQTLISLGNGGASAPKPTYRRLCADCHKTFKGLLGYRLHRSMKHGEKKNAAPLQVD